MPILKKTSNVNIVTQCEDAKSNLLESIEKNVAEGLEHTVELMGRKVYKILKKNQKKTDYKFTESSQNSYTPGITETCKLASKYVTDQWKKACSCLDGINLSAFLEQFGTIFAERLLRHLCKFTVSTGLGGSKLIQDLNQYKSVAQKFSNPSINKTFTELCKLANIHLVDKSSVMSLINDLKLTQFTKLEIKKYIKTHQHYINQWDDIVDCL